MSEFWVNVIGITMVVLMFGTPVALVAIGDYRKGKRKRGPRLGFSVRLNAWNDRVAYPDSGLYTDLDSRGCLHVFCETEEQRVIAEEYFPDAVIEQMTDEARFAFRHPSYGCLTTDKSDHRFYDGQ